MDISIPTLIGQAGTFLVLVLVTMKYVWPPLTQAMEQRRQKIAEGLAQSDEAEKALEKAEAEAEQIIREARAKSGEIIDQAGKRSNEIVEQAKQDAIAERDRQVAAAEADIKLATNQARSAARKNGRTYDQRCRAGHRTGTRCRTSPQAARQAGCGALDDHARRNHTGTTLCTGGVQPGRSGRHRRIVERVACQGLRSRANRIDEACHRPSERRRKAPAGTIRRGARRVRQWC